MDAGRLVGDDVMIGSCGSGSTRQDATHGFVLDGFPRTVAQAAALDRMVDGRGPLVVLDIVVPEDVLVRRLAARRICGTCGANAPPGRAPWHATSAAASWCSAPTTARTIVRERLRGVPAQTRSRSSTTTGAGALSLEVDGDRRRGRRPPSAAR